MKCLEEIYLELDSVNDEFVFIEEVLFKDNDFVEEGEIIASFESSKASIDIETKSSGYLKILFDVDSSEVKSGIKIFEIYDNKIEDVDEVINLNDDNKLLDKLGVEKDDKTSNKVKFSYEDKIISKKVLDQNIDLIDYNQYDIITQNQLDLVSHQIKPEKIVKNLNFPINKNRINRTEFVEEEISPTKSTEGNYLVQSNFTPISQLTTLIQCSKPKTSPLKLIIFECSRLLKSFKLLNSCFVDGKIIKYQDINIGVAFDDGVNGLKVAAIKNTDKLNINSIEDSLIDLNLNYSKNKLKADSLTSSTFTITDLYNSSTFSFKPLLNIENSSILGISSYNEVLNGFNIELSFDHRILSGLEISNFLNELKIRLESHLGNHEKDNQSSCSKCGRETEEDLDGSIFFIKTLYKGSNRLICSNCANGW